jgi:plastocyanin
MPDPRHFTTRRGFIAGLGFGAVSLYGAWAAYGAAPLPFGHTPSAAPEPEAHGHGGSNGDSHGGHATAAAPAAEDFRLEHETFLRTYAQTDGSVDPHAASHGDAHSHGHAHGASQGGHADAGHGGDASASEPVTVFLMAQKFAYSPDLLRLKAGQAYRFRMMADDITHGASIQLGMASRIIRLRPNIVSEQTITFTKPGEYLVYCTVYCGQAHDAMQGRIIVV